MVTICHGHKTTMKKSRVPLWPKFSAALKQGIKPVLFEMYPVVIFVVVDIFGKEPMFV